MSQIWKLVIENGVKSPHKKNCCRTNFALISRIFLVLVFLTPFNGLLPPLPEVQWFSESLEESDGKKWSQIWKLKGCKIAAVENYFTFFFHLFTQFKRLFVPTSLPKVQRPNFLDFWNSWGKVMERNGLRFENFCS